MKKLPLCLLLTGLLMLFAVGSTYSTAQPKLEFAESILDFGHIGIDYKVFYNFRFSNAGDAPLEIESVVPSCDCSRTHASAQVIQPGDSGLIRLEFQTRDYFGPTSQSFTITSNDPDNPTQKIFYVSTVGRWIRGIKPDPIYLFFLPGNSPKKITIANTHFPDLKASLIDQADDYFSVKLLKDKASQGEMIEVEVIPGEPPTPGTHNSNFRLAVDVPDKEEPVILTIPVKIVKY